MHVANIFAQHSTLSARPPEQSKAPLQTAIFTAAPSFSDACFGTVPFPSLGSLHLTKPLGTPPLLQLISVGRRLSSFPISLLSSSSSSFFFKSILFIKIFLDCAGGECGNKRLDACDWCLRNLRPDRKSRKMEKKGTVLMQRYELGRMLGQGTFAKVYHARSIATGQSVAIKMIDKERVFKAGMSEQIKREISVMRLVSHPNVVHLHEVMATKNKIYFAMDYVRGGELFSKIAKGGRLKEDDARKYFQQLIGAVDYCHSRGVYHRDLKPENLLLDENGDLKVSDFGLSALWESRRNDGLLHTTCGTPAYVAPEVINKKGYDGAKADVWSCGVVLFVLLAGYLPFHDTNLMEMYRKITKGDFKCPHWFSPDVCKLLARILDPNTTTRITTATLLENPWFKKGFEPVEVENAEQESAAPNIKDVISALTTSSKGGADGGEEKKPESPFTIKPTSLNAFDIISFSKGFDLSGLFEDGGSRRQEEARFMTKKPASAIVSKLEEIAEMERFKVKEEDGLVKLQGCKEGRKGQLAIYAEIFEVAPSYFMVEVKKSAGDTMEYQKFCNQDLRPRLKDIAWTWQGGEQQLLHA
ncbi:CBL-interacting serine/threonine-protein kinase 20 [Asimina triloba]